MSIRSLRPGLKNVCWPRFVVALLALVLLSVTPARSHDYYNNGGNNQNNQNNGMFGNSNDPFMELVFFQTFLTANLQGKPLTTFNFDLLLFEYVLDNYLYGRIPDQELTEIEMIELMINQQL